MQERKKNLRWSLVFALIAALTVWAVTSQWKNFSLGALAARLAAADPGWMAAAFAGMFGFLFFEGCAVRSACEALGYPIPISRGLAFAAADIYFSAITPSASGGQPACALLMRRRGIPGCVSAPVLMLTLMMYTLSILAIGLLSLLLGPAVFFSFGPAARILIAVGTVLQILLALAFFGLLRSGSLLRQLCFGVLRLLAKLRLIRNLEAKEARVQRTMDEYARRAKVLTGRRGLLLRSFLYNFLQRLSVISVSVFVFLALGGAPRHALRVLAMQSYVVIGSVSIPIPGAMGVTDFLMIDGFSALMTEELAVQIALIARAVSFYSCVLLCGLIVLAATRRALRENEGDAEGKTGDE